MMRKEIIFQPTIGVKAELIANTLSIDLNKAMELLSAPDTEAILQQAIADGIKASLDDVIKKMGRMRWPREVVSERKDVNIILPSLAIGAIQGT